MTTKTYMITTTTHEKFIHTVCEVIKEQAGKSIQEKDSFTFVLSGGKTPKDIFVELAKNYKNSIEWRKVHFFWLDERCVEPDHEDSNYKLAYDQLLSKLNGVGSVHRMKGELEPREAAKEYAQDIKNFFSQAEVKFDFILLGMGGDGHCASLFPESSELDEMKRLVVSTEKQYNGHNRISLTLPVINRSGKVLMISSQEKLDVFLDTQRALPIHLVNRENMKAVVRI
jgi:6-phosphogluconolactonase